MTKAKPEVKEKPSINEMKEAILRSGYLIESRLQTKMENAGFIVEINCPYPDPSTFKSRELDLKAFYFEKGNREGFASSALLIIEAINNSDNPVVFFEREQDTTIGDSTLKIVASPRTLISESGWTDGFHTATGLCDWHHSFNFTVATQWCSFVWKNAAPGRVEGWRAEHAEERRSDFHKLKDAMSFFESSTKEGLKTWREIGIVQMLPILVLQGEMYSAREVHNDLILEPRDYVRFHIAEHQNGQDVECQIDVITEQYLDFYMSMVKSEVHKVNEWMNNNEDELIASWERYAELDAKMNETAASGD